MKESRNNKCFLIFTLTIDTAAFFTFFLYTRFPLSQSLAFTSFNKKTIAESFDIFQ